MKLCGCGDEIPPHDDPGTDSCGVCHMLEQEAKAREEAARRMRARTVLGTLHAPYTLIPLIVELERADIRYALDGYGTIFLPHVWIELWIEARAAYCDRGRFLVHAGSRDPRVLSIDEADFFPRYYFHPACLVQEISTWLNVRTTNTRRRLEGE